jgi:hypothetical protein
MTKEPRIEPYLTAAQSRTMTTTVRRVMVADCGIPTTRITILENTHDRAPGADPLIAKLESLSSTANQM